ncbi:EAL domain-containing protein [Emcibacter sp. SYSU 3D8]|uniref:EAL domain-containing protein n=1 Tax=Emcibacter sp. SYSU 3D8 TaxID=3133969 RepID=UPI0031FE7C0A
MTDISLYGAEPEEPGFDRVHPGWVARRTRTSRLAGRESPTVIVGRAHNFPASFEAMLVGLDHAFQPIVNSHSGVCFGYEALLRNADRYGFETVQDFFDACYAAGILSEMEAALHEKAIIKFSQLPHADRVKLFLNVDNRVIDRLPLPGKPLDLILETLGLSRSGIVFEISERLPVRQDQEMLQSLERIKGEGLNIAIDDFGVGYSGLQLLYRVEPDYIKVDRYFIEGIQKDNRKRFLLSHIVDIARLLGISVIAEGVETEREFLVCKELGCDLVQGYLVQRPTSDVDALRIHYEDITTLSARERRRRTSDYHFIKDNMETIEAISIGTPMLTVLQKFSDRPRFAYFPVVDAMGVPLGVVRETDVKYYVYSRFGRDLLSNRSFAVTLGQIVSNCPVVDINSRAEKILEVFSVDNPAQCAIVTENMHYVGTLDAQSLLGILTEKNLAQARDQNPLTRMAGNTLIEEFISEALMDIDEQYVFAYFDFDYFKPFNDRFGFRNGDRAILMFSEIMRRTLRDASFLGHIGGDDFFAGFRTTAPEAVLVSVAQAQAEFAHEVSSLYGPEDRAAGSIMGEDRSGKARSFPLMRVSAAVVRIPAERGIRTTEELVQLMTSLKKDAKQAADNLGYVALADLESRV